MVGLCWPGHNYWLYHMTIILILTSHSHSLNCFGTFTHMYITSIATSMYTVWNKTFMNGVMRQILMKSYFSTHANFSILIYVFGFVLIYTSLKYWYRHLNHTQLWFKLKQRYLALVETLFIPSHSSKCLLSGIMFDSFMLQIKCYACCQQKLILTTTTKNHLQDFEI